MNLRIGLLALAFVVACLGGRALADAAPAHETAHSEAGHHAESRGGSAEHAKKGVDPLHVSPDLAIWTLIVFLAVLVVLRSMAWEPIAKALMAREKGIADDLAAASAKHEEASDLLTKHEARLASAADDVRAMLEEARRDAEATKAQIVTEAQEAANAEKVRAVREINQARDGAITGLAEHSAHLAIDLAAKVVKQDISSDRQGEIVREALSRMANPEPSSN